MQKTEPSAAAAISGYSGTPLAKKLGIKEGFRIRLANQPAYYYSLFTDMPADVKEVHSKKEYKQLVHFFATTMAGLQKEILSIRAEIFPDGSCWISWPKKAAKIQTDVTEDKIRSLALANGLVDIKVCAVDEIWSRLKLVVPVKDRVGISKQK